MGSTNKTSYLDLSQFVASDRPSWLGDYNNDMRKISEGVRDIAVTANTVTKAQIEALNTQVGTLSQNVADNSLNIGKNTGDISALSARVDTNTADISKVDQREAEHFTALSNNQTAYGNDISDLKDRQTYFAQNMNKIELQVDVNTSSISKLQTQVIYQRNDIEDLKDSVGEDTADIGEIKTDIDSIKTVNINQDTDIRNLQTATSSVQAFVQDLDTRVDATEAYGNRISALETVSDNHTAEINEHAGDIAALDADYQQLATKTSGIADGVPVPFGFGTTAGGKRGYMDADGTIKEFSTEVDISEVNAKVTQNTNDITALKDKTAGITDGKALPYSLAIAEGGAYGYIPNGETGVVPFLNRSDVEGIVDIAPLRNDINAVSERTTTLEGEIDTVNASVSYVSNQQASLDSQMQAINTSVEALSNDLTAVKNKTANIGGGFIENPKLDCSVTYEYGDQGGSNSITIQTEKSGGNNFTIKTNAAEKMTLNLFDGLGQYPDAVLDLPFSFGIDSNGNYGYKKVGADTVTPFKSGMPELPSNFQLGLSDQLSNAVVHMEGLVDDVNNSRSVRCVLAVPNRLTESISVYANVKTPQTANTYRQFNKAVLSPADQPFIDIMNVLKGDSRYLFTGVYNTEMGDTTPRFIWESSSKVILHGIVIIANYQGNIYNWYLI